MSLNDDATRLLTDEERLTLDGEYDPEADSAAAAAAQGVSQEPQDSDAEEGDDTGGEEENPSGDNKETGQEKAVDDTYAQDPSFVAYESKLPQDYDAQVQANKDARKQLRAKFDDGDIDQGELDAELEKLDEQRLSLSAVKQRAEIAQEMNEQAAARAWQTTINAFMGDAASKPELGVVDYKKDESKAKDLDHFVKALAAMPGNESKPMRWYLDEAHKRVVALHQVPLAKATETKSRKPDLSRIPANLAEVPGVATQDMNDDEFAAIDKMKGPDAERAYAQLSLEKQRLYLARS